VLVDGVEVVGLQRFEPALEREVAVGERLRLALQQAHGAAEPAAAHRLLQPDAAVLVRQLDGDERRTLILPRGDVSSVRALEERHRLDDLVGEVRAPREQLEVLRAERLLRVGLREQVVALAPAPLRDRRASGFDPVEHFGHVRILAHVFAPAEAAARLA
jgi:hypothetical protein